MLREAEHILRQHVHKKEFWILTTKCGNKRKHENEAEGPWPRGAMVPQPRFRVLAYFHIYWSKFKILFLHVLMKDVQLL